MTRFDGDAIPQRVRSRKTYTGKELRRDMKKFVETGVHPEVERARQEQMASTSRPTHALPPKDVNRPFVFLEFTAGRKVLGRIVLELFEDQVAVAASHFRQRCLEGASDCFKGTTVHKLFPGFGLYAGRAKTPAVACKLPRNPRLQHVERGAVSISEDGTELALTFDKALVLDKTHQVVGRLHLGEEVLEALAAQPTGPADAPCAALAVSRCGPTNCRGTTEEAGADGKADGKASLADDMAVARESLRDAMRAGLQQGLGKRKAAPDVGNGKAGPGAKASRSGLDILGTDDDEDEEEEEEEEEDGDEV